MIKTIRSKSNVSIGTTKLGTNTVCNSLMGAFYRVKLMTAIKSSRTDSKAVTLKEFSYFSKTIHFFSLIKAHISSVVSSRTVGSKPITKILQRNSLRLESFTPNVLGEVVSDEQPTSFTMNSKVITTTLEILGTNTGKTKIH